MREFISFDIGGTAVKYGVINEVGDRIFDSSFPTEAHKGIEQIIDNMVHIVHRLKKQYPVSGIAISSAGVVDPDEGIVLHTTNVIKGYDGTPMKSLLEERTGFATEINNDVNCFALCESRLGAASDVEDALVMTVGTGIGGGIIQNNKLFYGEGYAAGEFGQMSIEGGIFEHIASTTALVNEARKAIGPSINDGVDVFNAYDQGNPRAKKCIEKFYDNLAKGVSNLIYVFNPKRIVIGGGISEREAFVGELEQALKKHCRINFLNDVTIKSARFQNKSGLIGAVFSFLEQEDKR